MSNLTPYEQYYLELINRGRADPIAEAARYGIDLNQGISGTQISSAAKAPLAANNMLNNAAADHSIWMLNTNTFDHTGVGGSSPGDRIEDAGYTNWYTWGENIARRSASSSNPETTGVIEALHRQLFLSSGHRKNLMSANFQEVGLGVEYGPFNGFTNAIVTQNFASSRGGPFVLGVVFDDLDGDDFFDPGEELPGVTVTISGVGQVVTGPGGGYELRVSSNDDFTVTFSGGGLSSAVGRSISIGSENVKLDLILDEIDVPPPSDDPIDPPTPEDDDPVGEREDEPVVVFDQTVQGSDEPDLQAFSDGADRVFGQGGDDTLSGLRGHDWINGNRGDDHLTGGLGHDTLIGGLGSDTLRGLIGKDDLRGLGGRDLLEGGGGRDQLSGGGGRDTLIGGKGADTLKGGGGPDWFEFKRGDGRDVIEDFAQRRDKIVINEGANNFSDLQIAQAGDDVMIRFANVRIRVEDDNAAAFTASDFLF